VRLRSIDDRHVRTTTAKRERNRAASSACAQHHRMCVDQVCATLFGKCITAPVSIGVVPNRLVTVE
jgi:hypothetical protein